MRDNSIFRSMMILRRQWNSNDSYAVNWNSLVELSLSVGQRGGDEAYYTYIEEADDAANAESALI